MTATKTKLSISLSEDLVARIDREASRTRSTRSGVVESWLRDAARASARREIEQATVDYYETLTQAERDEGLAIARGAARAARRLEIEEPAPRSHSPRRRP